MTNCLTYSLSAHSAFSTLNGVNPVCFASAKSNNNYTCVVVVNSDERGDNQEL
jgi:hypothetical protein